MSKYPRSVEACISKFLNDLDKELLTPKTIEFYRSTVKVVVDDLIEGGYDPLPYKLSEDAVRWLLSEKWIKLTVKTRKGYRATLSRFAEHFGNDVVRRVKIRFPHDMRPNVRRLTPAQANQLWRLDMTPTQRLVIHVELFMGFRRVEALRLTEESILQRHLSVSGKGGLGGKPRLVPFHQDTPAILDNYLTWRNEQIAIVKKKRPTAQIPDQLLIYRKGYSIRAYTDKGLDRHVSEKLSVKVGFKFSNHDLRRTFARRLAQQGNKLRTIADLLGHETISETEKYIGRMDDKMTEAMENLSY